MKDSLKSISAELAEQIVAKFTSPEMKKLIADTKAAPDGDTGTFEVIITTENLDRYSEVIKLDGWDLAHYRNNPVVLWGHDHDQPIGMATSVDIIDGRMIAKGKFAPTDKAQEVRKLYDFGIIKATSVGFIEKEREGNLITKAELLEFSFVSVPANPYALTLAMQRDLSVNELVTKGLMFVEKSQEEVAVEAEPEVAVVEEPVVTPEVVDQDTLAEKVASLVISKLKDANVVLDAEVVTPEPEHNDADSIATDVPADETEEEAQMRRFNESRRTVQTFATLVGEILADARLATRDRR